MESSIGAVLKGQEPCWYWSQDRRTDINKKTMDGDATLWHQRTEYVTVPKNPHDAGRFTNTARRRIIGIPVAEGIHNQL